MADHSSADSVRLNRLADEISPYLLLHKTNPVDWYPWGDEAIARARDENKPIFLSVGYATCFWCHVMERESFADADTAALMNEAFINIKLDREERPELDEIYMTATQLLTGQGGWPNSVFLTPDLKPFYAGTYFPPKGRHGLPGFRDVLDGLAKAWQERRNDVQMQADEMEQAIDRYLSERGAPVSLLPPAEVATRAVERLSRRFDAEHGGFGGAPKFPSPSNLYLLEALAEGDDEAARMLDESLDHMARGGLFDQLGGGFHRYATDQEWKIPHFEKMLYDNAHLLALYTRAHARTGNPEAERIVRATAAFLAREMTGEHGELWSAIDAETAGREGAFYVWTLGELTAVLGAEDAGFLAPIYGFSGAPFFEDDHFVLHLPDGLATQAERRHMTYDDLLAQIEPLRARLFETRAERPRPLTDDKVLTDWNGMAIHGLALAARHFDDADMLDQARRAASFVLEHLDSGEGPLRHSWRAGETRVDALLGDYVFFVQGLLTLHEADPEGDWLAAAMRLTDEQIERLADAKGGFFTSAQRDDVLVRSKEVLDGALPAANAIAALNLIELARLDGDARWRQHAETTLKAFAIFASRALDGAKMLTLAVHRFHAVFPGVETSDLDAPMTEAEETARDVVQARFGVGEIEEGDWIPFRLEVTLSPGWHVYAHQPGAPVPATRLEGQDATLRDVVYPGGDEKVLADSSTSVMVYSGTFEVVGRVRPTSEQAKLRLHYQACDDRRCLPVSGLEVELGRAMSS